MGYDRTYSREEIHQILYLSERRLRPSAPVGNAEHGHAISRHTEQRENPFDRRSIARDSTFASRKDLVLAVEEVLHSTAGQQQLTKLNASNVESCVITAQLIAMSGKIKANVVQNPRARVGSKTVAAQVTQYLQTQVPVNSVFVLVDKVAAAESWAPIHIQTAYPKD